MYTKTVISKIMKNKNPKILFSLRILKHIIDNFIDTFFVLYFLDVSSENIIPLGIYQILQVAVTYFAIYFLRNRARTKHRVALMRIAMLLDIVYFLAIITLQTRVVDFAYLLGALRGLEEGLYYSVYNIIESDGVKNQGREKFVGNYKALSNATSVIFPVIFGSLIYETSFIQSLIVVVIIVASRLILSTLYQDQNIPRSKRTNLKKFRTLVASDQRFRRLGISDFFYGLVFSSSAFSQIVTIYVIKFFSDSFTLGIFTSIFSIVAGLVGIAFAKFLKKQNYAYFINLSMFGMIAALLAMVFDCNIVTVVLFKLFHTIAKEGTAIIVDTNRANLCNDAKIKREYKPEFWVNVEQHLVVGRVLSNVLFIAMAFTESWVPIMIIFAILFGVSAFTLVRTERAIVRPRESSSTRRLLPSFRTVSEDENE